MGTYQFDFTVVTDGDTEGDAMEEAMQLLADYRFAKEAATVTVVDADVDGEGVNDFLDSLAEALGVDDDSWRP